MMTENGSNQTCTGELRSTTTEQLQQRLDERKRQAAPADEADRLLYELQEHEIELEIQNRELREAQLRLEESRDRYADLYDSAPIGYLTFNAHGVIRELNLTAAALLGNERQRLVGFPFVHFLAAESRPAFFEHLRECKRSRSARSELKLAADGDAIEIAMVSAAVGQAQDIQFRAAIIDVTARKRAETALQSARDELEERVRTRTAELEAANRLLREEMDRRERLEAELRSRMNELAESHRRKDEFLAMLSHELRNPLAPVCTGLELLKRDTPENTRAHSIQAMIERQLSRLVRLVDDLLEVARVQSGKIRLHNVPVDLRAVAQDATDSAGEVAQARRQSLLVELPDAALWVEGDEARLGQVLSNLISNALKYTDEGGVIHVTLARRGDQAELRVADTGHGIPSEFLPRVFELFSQGERTLDRAQGGLGIGLTLVKQLVELHGGRVEAFSAGAGAGSQFVVTLPLMAHPETARPKSAEPAAEGQVRPLRVLIVDDNEDAAATTAALVQQWGHDTQYTCDARDALQLARRLAPNVVLLDIGLPGLDGYAVARALRDTEETAGALLVALTGYGRDEDKDRAYAAGFDEHLTKPVDVGRLDQLLRRYVQRNLQRIDDDPPR